MSSLLTCSYWDLNMDFEDKTREHRQRLSNSSLAIEQQEATTTRMWYVCRRRGEKAIWLNEFWCSNSNWDVSCYWHSCQDSNTSQMQLQWLWKNVRRTQNNHELSSRTPRGPLVTNVLGRNGPPRTQLVWRLPWTKYLDLKSHESQFGHKGVKV